MMVLVVVFVAVTTIMFVVAIVNHQPFDVWPSRTLWPNTFFWV
jgi:hypothetical protein